MKLVSVPQHGKLVPQRNSAIFWVMGFILCYQAGYQLYMSFLLHHDVAPQDPWCDGSLAASQQCIEAQLFRGWERDDHLLEESHDKPEALLQHDHDAGLLVTIEKPTSTLPIQVNSSFFHPFGTLTKQERMEERERKTQTDRDAGLHAWSERRHERHYRAAAAAMSEWHNMTAIGRDLQALRGDFGSKIAQRQASTQLAKEEWSNLTEWARDVQALHQHFETKFLPGDQHDRQATTTPADNMTAWSRSLVELQQHMEERMAAMKKKHAAVEAKHQAEKSDMPLLDQIAAVGKELCMEPSRREYPQCAQFVSTSHLPLPVADATSRMPQRLHRSDRTALDKAEAQLESDLHQLSIKHQTWEKAFMSKVANITRDLCSEPKRRGSSACAEFHSNNASAAQNARHQTFAVKIANVGRELCSNPLRHGYLLCKQFFSENAPDSHSRGDLRVANKSDDEISSQVPEDYDGAKSKDTRIHLKWSTVVSWEQNSPKFLRGSETQAVTLTGTNVSKMRVSAFWSGRIPSVACVALVPKSKSTKAWLRYFIDNFRLQNYEGARQLILVHHHTDHEVGELLREYEDGSYIRTAVARGDEFPSAPAFRFGAWLAKDADIIARWDFGAWHHPHRLSAQVRALAFTARPACLLARWTILDKSGANATEVAGKHWEGSLVGEAAWMRSNWYPEMMSQERAVFDAISAREIVKIDMPGLEVFDESLA